MRHPFRLRSLVGLLVGLAACGLVACDTHNPLLDIPTTEPTTDPFSGTLAPNGALIFPFIATTTGTVTATLLTVTPAATVGMEMGTWDPTTSTCTIVLTKDGATAGTTLSGTSSSAGNYCLRFLDSAGTLTDAVAISAEVLHP